MNIDVDKYMHLALAEASRSFEAGAFPAGAVLICGDEVIAQDISGTFPKIQHHAESKVIDAAMEKLNRQLNDCILFTSMQSCLMCTGKTYWAGIRKVYYGLKKENTLHTHYESPLNYEEIVGKFNEKIEYIYVPEFEQQALQLVTKWEELNLPA